MMHTLAVIGFVVLVASIVFGALWLIHWVDRRRVRRLIEQDGGEAVRIEWIEWPRGWRFFFGDSSATHWRVEYRARDGQLRVAECSASGLRCKVYRDEAAADPTIRSG